MPDTISRVLPAPDTTDDGERADHASDAFRIGCDADGCEHIFSRIRDTVTVRDDGEHVHTQSVADCSLSHWLRHIEDTRGWNETWIFED